MKSRLAAVIIAIGTILIFVAHFERGARLRTEADLLREQARSSLLLSSRNASLRNSLTERENASREVVERREELTGLRERIQLLRAQASEAAGLQAQNRDLYLRLANRANR